jgi:hypothetical protein
MELVQKILQEVLPVKSDEADNADDDANVVADEADDDANVEGNCGEGNSSGRSDEANEEAEKEAPDSFADEEKEDEEGSGPKKEGSGPFGLAEAQRALHKENCRQVAVRGQQKQAQGVNARRLQDFKNVLELGDICIYKLDGYIKGATDKKGLPVMVCGMRRYTSPVTQEVSFSYQVCSQHGYLKQRVDRGSLDHYSQLTAELMSINEKAEGFLSGLTID